MVSHSCLCSFSFFFSFFLSVLTLSSSSSVLPLSRYPLIIQLENHCNVQNQKLIAKSLTQILGEAIWIPKKEGKTFTASTTSPNLLKNKILIEASHSYFHSFSFLLPSTVSLSLFCSSFYLTYFQFLVVSYTLSFHTKSSFFFVHFLPRVTYSHNDIFFIFLLASFFFILCFSCLSSCLILLHSLFFLPNLIILFRSFILTLHLNYCNVTAKMTDDSFFVTVSFVRNRSFSFPGCLFFSSIVLSLSISLSISLSLSSLLGNEC